MGSVNKETRDTWGQGVITSMEPDAIPPEAYSRGKNVELTSIGGGKAVPKQRKGFTTLNATPITGSTAIIGLHEFKERSGGLFIHHHLVVSDNGRLDEQDVDDGTISAINATAFTSSSTQEHIPDFANAQNLCFIVNGEEQIKFDGTDDFPFGIVKPSTAPTITASATAGSHNGTYEARVTFFNDATGQESSAGPTSATASPASKQLDWSSVPTSSDSQVSSRNLYLRNTATQANFYLAGTIANNVDTTATTNLLDSSLTVVGPDPFENDPPPSNTKCIEFHKGRLFAMTPTAVHYSKLQKIESFDPGAYEEINPEDAQEMSGLVSVFDIIVVFKTTSMHAIVGDDPNSWTIQQIHDTLGCVNHRSIVVANGRLYWWSKLGPVVWDGAGLPVLIGPPFISETLDPANVSYDDTTLGKITGCEDPVRERVLWAIPEISQTRNTLILPWNYRLERWESDGWDPFDVSCLATLDNNAEQPTVVAGGYKGQTFRFGESNYDGVDSSKTSSGTFVAAGTSSSTIIDLTATFDTTGGGFIERKVTVVDANGREVNDGVRYRITANTGTTLTLATTITGLIPGDTYTYYIGGPALDLMLGWWNQSDTFFKKRYMFVYVHIRTGDPLDEVYFSVYHDYNLDDDAGLQLTFEAESQFALWDDPDTLWDEFLWSGSTSGADVVQRYRIGRTGIAQLLRVRHFKPGADFTFLKAAVIFEQLSERLG